MLHDLQRKIHRLAKKYGMTLEEYNKMLAAQGGRCAVCRTKDPKNKWGVFCVDHCHKTGQVRGLLCVRCNIVLGHLGDNLSGIMRFADYLQLGPSHREAKVDAETPRRPHRIRYVVYIDALGKQVPKGTAGATTKRMITRTWYACIRGKEISLKTTDEQEAWKRMRGLICRLRSGTST